jgi:hypothetical protein
VGTKAFSELVSLKIQLDKKIRDEGSRVIVEHARTLFENYPELSAIRWEQYTDYFNDGDQVSFSVHELEWQRTGTKHEFNYLPHEAKIPLSAEDKKYYETYHLDLITIDNWWLLARDLHSFCDDIQYQQDLMLAIFGDHKTITLYRDGKIKIDKNEDHD